MIALLGFSVVIHFYSLLLLILLRLQRWQMQHHSSFKSTAYNVCDLRLPRPAGLATKSNFTDHSRTSTNCVASPSMLSKS